MNNPHTTIASASHHGAFWYMPHSGGVLQNTIERRFVDGTIQRYEHVTGLVWGGRRYFRPVEFIDPYDNRTTWTYDSTGRVTRVAGPDGVDQIYIYNPPTWIGTGTGQWSSASYSGIEIKYVDRLANDNDLKRTVYRLYRRRQDSTGAVIQGCRPESGDLLFRIYSPAGDAVDPIADPHQPVLVDLTTDRPRMHVREYAYDGSWPTIANSPNIATINVRSAEGVLANAPITAAIPIVTYTYTIAGGRKRVWEETQHQTGATYGFTYVNDIDSPLRVQKVTRTGAHDNVVKEWTLDDYERVTSITTTPPNDAIGRPRAFDADNGGHVEPVAMTVNYTYSGCSSCASRPSSIQEMPSGRRWEYDYDSLTGLLLQARTPDPSGASQTVATTFTYDPCVPGSLYGAYKMTSITTPDGVRWDATYVSVARATPSGAIDWGVKHATVTWTSPSITLADGATHPPIQLVSHYDTRPPQLDGSGQQTGLVGVIQSEQDGDGITTSFEYDAAGTLTAVVRNPGGGALSLRSEFDFARDGDLRSTTTGVGSSLPRLLNISYDDGGQAKVLTSSVNGQVLEERRYYDVDGNLTVVLEKNKTSAGAAPNDFGPSPRVDVARDWLRSEYHYKAGRLVLEFKDRQALDMDDSRAVADAADARFVRRDYDWTPDGNLAVIAHANGSATNFVYDGYGTLYKAESTSVGLPSLLLGKYFVNSALDLVREYRGNSSVPLVTTFTRNAAGTITQAAEPSVSSPAGYPWTVEAATHEFVVDALGRLTESRTMSGQNVVARETRYYDELSRVYKKELFDGASPTAGQVFTTLWEGASKAKKSTGPAGRFVERTFDALARVSEIRNGFLTTPDKTVFEYFNNTGFLKKTTRRNWDSLAPPGYVERDVEYVRDNLGRVQQMRVGPSASALVHSFSYYSSGLTESYTDPSGKVEKYLPDALGRLNERFLPGTAAIWNGTTHVDWTSSDRSELLQVDGRGRTTRTIYDFAGRPIVVMEPGAETEPTTSDPHQQFARLLAYDAASRLSTIHGADYVNIALERDGVGRVIMRSRVAAGQDPLLVSNFYGRDEIKRNVLGQILETRSYLGAELGGAPYVVEQFTHDAFGRLHEERFAYIYTNNISEVESSYAADGDPFRSAIRYRNNLTGDADDLWMRYVPDAVGRLQGMDWKTSEAAAWTALATYQHVGDAIRRRTTSWGLGHPTPPVPGSFDTTYRYDAYGRMDRIDQSFDAQAFVEFHYDLASNLVKEVYNKQGGASRKGDRSVYDEHHRLKKAWLGSDQQHLDASDPDGGVGAFVQKLTYGLDTANNRTTVANQAGQGGPVSTTTYTVQDAAHLQGESNRYDTIDGDSMLYDSRGNTGFDGRYYYVYDAFDRLTEVYAITGTQQQVGGGGGTSSSSSGGGGGGTGTVQQPTYAVSDPSALRSARAAILSRVGTPPVDLFLRSEDPTFLPTLREPLSQTAVQFSGTSSSSSSSPATQNSFTLDLRAIYLYDLMNRRVVRMVTEQPTRYYAWDGWQEAQELVFGSDGSNPVARPEGQFVWGEQLDELVSYRDNQSGTWSAYYVAESGAHCPSRILDSTGAVVEIQEYDPYGKTSLFDGSGASLAGSAVGNSFGWKGHRIDPETGLVYMRHRYYSTEWGRFVTQDPLGVWSDTLTMGNDYSYCGDNPLVRCDPFGLQVFPFGATRSYYQRDEKMDDFVADQKGEERPSERRRREERERQEEEKRKLEEMIKQTDEMFRNWLEALRTFPDGPIWSRLHGSPDVIQLGVPLGPGGGLGKGGLGKGGFRKGQGPTTGQPLGPSAPQPSSPGKPAKAGAETKPAEKECPTTPGSQAKPQEPKVNEAVSEKLQGRAPKYHTPNSVISGTFVNDLGQVQPWVAHYDAFGRLIARTDYNAGNAKAGIPVVHHSTYEYGRGYEQGREASNHVPGPYVPGGHE